MATTQNVVIDTSNDTGPGGDITLAALANGAKGGNVWLSTSNTAADIYSWSSATRSTPSGLILEHGGSVNIFAGASSGTSIRLADVYTSGNGAIGIGTSANSGPVTGALIIHTSQATTSDGKALTINSLGSITSGNSIVPGALQNAGIVAGVLNTAGAGGSGFNRQDGGNGGYLQVSAGASLTSDSILSFGAGGASSGNGGRGGDISISAGSLNVRGDINSSGGGAGGVSAFGVPGPGYGGSAGNIDLQISNTLVVSPGRQGTGLILATSGSDANLESGGGSFGGGGGQSSGILSKGYAGSGTTGGGSAGHTGFPAQGGPGGGGGFNGSGGGGGGGAYVIGSTWGSRVGGAGGGGGASSNGNNSVDSDLKLSPGGFFIGFGGAGGGGGIGGGAIGGGANAPSSVTGGGHTFGGQWWAGGVK